MPPPPAPLPFFTVFAVGFAFAFGGQNPDSPQKTFIGSQNFFLMNVEDMAFWLFEYAFSAASATIVAGTLAERCQMVAYLCYSVLLGGFVYPVIAHTIWSAQGFLSCYSIDPLWGTGMVDFAGSGVVHLTGGTTALFATMILGPRRGRFHDDTGRRLDKPKEFPGHSVALQVGSFGSLVLICLSIAYTVVVSTMLDIDAWNLHSLVWVVWFQRWFSAVARHP